ncbi:MAG: fluoride efflux transporter CrcB [Flavobacteriales bacterium]|nr:fluoride efflux transporter CrcB [Flavobacteriales bacterium]
MKEVLAVFVGGGLGSVARFTVGRWVGSLHTHYWPFGTLLINIIACALIGLLVGFADHKHWIGPTTRLLLVVGFCGGFSTFSAFSTETLTLLQQGHHTGTLLYVGASVVLCVLATFGGLVLAERL